MLAHAASAEAASSAARAGRARDVATSVSPSRQSARPLRSPTSRISPSACRCASSAASNSPRLQRASPKPQSACDSVHESPTALLAEMLSAKRAIARSRLPANVSAIAASARWNAATPALPCSLWSSTDRTRSRSASSYEPRKECARPRCPVAYASVERSPLERARASASRRADSPASRSPWTSPRYPAPQSPAARFPHAACVLPPQPETGRHAKTDLRITARDTTSLERRTNVVVVRAQSFERADLTRARKGGRRRLRDLEVMVTMKVAQPLELPCRHRVERAVLAKRLEHPVASRRGVLEAHDGALDQADQGVDGHSSLQFDRIDTNRAERFQVESADENAQAPPQHLLGFR